MTGIVGMIGITGRWNTVACVISPTVVLLHQQLWMPSPKSSDHCREQLAQAMSTIDSYPLSLLPAWAVY